MNHVICLLHACNTARTIPLLFANKEFNMLFVLWLCTINTDKKNFIFPYHIAKQY